MPDRHAPLIRLRALTPGGQPLRIPLLDMRIMSVVIKDESGKTDKITITLDNRDLALFERGAALSLIGRPLSLQFGYFGEMSPPRKLILQRMKASGDKATLTGYSESVRMSRRQKVRSWSEVKRSDVARIIAIEQGFTTQYIEDSDVVLPCVQQRAESDAAFLRRLARREGWIFRVDDRGFHFRDEDWSTPAVRVFTWRGGNGDLISFSLDVDYLRYEAKTQSVGVNPKDKSEHGAEASQDGGDGMTKDDEAATTVDAVEGEDGVFSFGDDDDGGFFDEVEPTDVPVGFDVDTPPPPREPLRSRSGKAFFDPAGQGLAGTGGGVVTTINEPSDIPFLKGAGNLDAAGRINLDDFIEAVPEGERGVEYNPDGTTVKEFFASQREIEPLGVNEIGFGLAEEVTSERDTNLQGEVILQNSAPPAINKREAKARFLFAQRNRIKLGLQTIGDPALRSDRMISVGGLGPIISGDYYIQAVEHTLAATYQCKLQVRAQGEKKRGGGGERDTGEGEGDVASQLTAGGADLDDGDDGW